MPCSMNLGEESAVRELLKLLRSHHGEDGGRGSSEELRTCNRSGAHDLEGFLQLESRDDLVDTALGMLGFSASTLCHAMTGVVVQNLITLLLATISCGKLGQCTCMESKIGTPSNVELQSTACCTLPLRSPFEGDALSVSPRDSRHRRFECGHVNAFFGSSLSDSALLEIVDGCQTWLRTDGGEGILAVELLEVLLKVASVMTTFKPVSPGSFVFCKENRQFKVSQNSESAHLSIDHLLNLALEGKKPLYNSFSPHTRLLAWRLQPQCLKQDITFLVEKAVERPLLSLKNELLQRVELHNMVVGLALGPELFTEARRVLVMWLLSLGAACIWEIMAELTSAVRNVLENPGLWGLSVEAGAHLPPLHCFYSHEQQTFLKVLDGPSTLAGLMKILSMLEHQSLASNSQNLSNTPLDGLEPHQFAATNPVTKLEGLGSFLPLQDSVWALLMDFPHWLLFASLLLFHQESAYLCELRFDHQESAARYIAWLVSPLNERQRGAVVRGLVKIAKSWVSIWDSDMHASLNETRIECFPQKHRKLSHERTLSHKVVAEDFSSTEAERVQNCLVERSVEVVSHKPRKDVLQEVEQWLADFDTWCSQLGNLSYCDKENVSNGMKRMQPGKNCLAKGMQQTQKQGIGQGSGETWHESDEFCSPTRVSCCSSTCYFLGSLPLAALAANLGFLNYDVASLIFRFIISKDKYSIHDGKGISGEKGESSISLNCDFNSCQTASASKKDLLIREPAHRTEDFRDSYHSCACPEACSSASWAIGVATIFRFLDGINVINDEIVTDSLCEFKEVAAKLLLEYILHWSKHSDCHILSLLCDLHHRASLWFTHSGIQGETCRSFEKALLQLDILIASMLGAP